jgi:hypothetical protein
VTDAPGGRLADTQGFGQPHGGNALVCLQDQPQSRQSDP